MKTPAKNVCCCSPELVRAVERLSQTVRAGPDSADFPRPRPYVPEVLYSLVTGEGAPVVSNPAKKPTGDSNDWRKRDDAKHPSPAYKVDEADVKAPAVNDNDANCHGTTFGGGAYWIDPNSVPAILRDNYLKIDLTTGQKARVCNVMTWGKPPAHSALVVEVDSNGKPTMVIGKNGDLGRLWAHPPDDYGKDWEVHERRNGFDGATAEEVKGLKEAYDNAKADADKNPDDKAKRKKAHLAAYEMCRRKNKLKEKS